MKVVAISDLHGYLPDIPECNLLIIAGDFCPVRDHGIIRQSVWLHTEFRKWLETVPADLIIGIAGNHDLIYQRAPLLVQKLPWTYLEDDLCLYKGYKIYGTPWQPTFGSGWVFNLDEEGLKKRWDKIYHGTEILITHGPPYGYGDYTRKMLRIEGEEEMEHAGSPSLTERIKELQKLKLHIFGHIHNSFGQYELINFYGNAVTLANVSLVDNKYQPTHSIMEFELPDVNSI